MGATITVIETDVPAFLASLTNIRVVWQRNVRTVEGTSYDRAAHAFVTVMKQEAYAGQTLGYTGKDVYGRWTTADTDGWIIDDDMPNHVAAIAAAHRAFGPVIVA